MATDLGTAFGRISIDTGGGIASIGRLRASMGGFGRSGALPMVGALAAVGGAFAHVVGTAADFDKAMSAVGAVSNATAPQMAALHDQALALGQATVFSATQAAQAQGELVKAGVSVQDVLGGGLQGALSLAAAGELDLGDAAKIAANAMNLFGLQGRDVTGIADALATAANATTADVGDFGMALTQGGGAAKAAGLSFRDTVTILEALAQAGVKNSDAGTSLKNALIQVLAPTKQAAAAMRAHGLVLTDARGRFVDAATASERLRKATEGMTAAQKVAFLSTIAGTDGFRTLLALIDAGPAKLDSMNRALGRHGSAAETAAKRQDNLRGDLEQLSGAVQTAEIRLGELATGGLRTAAQAATGFIQAISDPGAISGFFGAIADSSVGDVFRALVDDAKALEPALLGIAAAGLGVVNALSGLGSAAAGALGFLEPTIHLLAQGAEVAGGLAGGLLSLAGSFAGSTAGMVVLTAATVALGGAMVGTRVATLALAAAQRVQAIAGSVGAFLSLAKGVRSAGDAMSLLRTAIGSGSFLAKLATPTGLAAAGIALVGTGVVALAAHFIGGEGPAHDFARAMDDVKAAAKDAAGAVDSVRAATDKITAANLRQTSAALSVERAHRDLAAAVSTYGAKSLEAREAANRLASAQEELRQATRGQTAANRDAVTTVGAMAAKLATLADKNATAKDKADALVDVNKSLSNLFAGRLSPGMQQAQADLEKVNNSSSTAAAKMSALQRYAAQAADAIKGNSPAAQEARAALEKLATASPGQLTKFVADIKTGTDNGKSKAQATSDAIKKLLGKAGDAKVNMAGFAASITEGGKAAIAAAEDIRSKVQQKLRGASPDQPGSEPPLTTFKRGLSKMVTAARDAAATLPAIADAGRERQVRAWRATATQVAAAGADLQAKLDAIDRQENTRQRRREADYNIHVAKMALLRTKDGTDARKQAEQQVRDAEASRKDLERVLAQEESDRQRLARLRAPAERAQAALSSISDIRQAADTAGQDIASKITSSLQTAFESAGKAIDTALQTQLDGIATNLKNLTDGIDRNLHAQLDAVDSGLSQTMDAITHGVAVNLANVANLPAATRAAFEQVAGQTAAQLAAINNAELSQLTAIGTATAQAMADIANAAAAQLGPAQAQLDEALSNVSAIDAELKRRQDAQTDRQEQAALTQAQADKASADAEVAKLQAIQDAARTDSERQAAANLLAAAIQKQADAAQAVTDAQDAIDTTSLERQRASWQAMADTSQDAVTRITQNADAASQALGAAADAQAQAVISGADAARQAAIQAAQDTANQLADVARTTAQQIADTATMTATAIADQARTAAEAGAQAAKDALDARLADVQTTLERNLGNLGQALATNNAKLAASAVAGLVGILNAPDVQAALATSGVNLGVSFSAGLEASIAIVKTSATKLAQAIADVMVLHSPAKEGPLAFDFTRSGLVIGQDIAAGLRASAAIVSTEARRVAAGAAAGVAPAAFAAGTPSSAAGAQVTQNNTFVVQRPVEDVRTWSERAMWEARLAGGRI